MNWLNKLIIYFLFLNLFPIQHLFSFVHPRAFENRDTTSINRRHSFPQKKSGLQQRKSRSLQNTRHSHTMAAQKPRSKSTVTPIRNRTQEKAQSRLMKPQRKNISKRKVRSSRRSQSEDHDATAMVKRRLDAALVSVQELSSSSPINPEYPLNKNPETISPSQGIAVKMPISLLNEYTAFNKTTRLGLREFLKLKFGYEKPVATGSNPTSHKRNSKARNRRYADRQKRKMNRWNRKQDEKRIRATKKIKAGKK